MTAANKLSGEYWNLHRNSLFLSAALFMACVIPDVGRLQFLGIEIEGMGASALTLLLMISATYCYGIFIIEWIDEALSDYRTRLAVLVTNGEGLNAISAGLSRVIRDLENVKTGAQDVVEKIKNGGVQLGANGLTNAVTRAQHQINETSSWALSRAQDPRDRVKSMQPEVAKFITQTLERYIFDFHEAVVSSIETESEKSAELLASCVNDIAIKIDTIAPQTEIISASIKRVGFRIYLARSHEFMRYMVFGLVAPTLAYSFAIVHGFGKIGISIGPSVIIKLLRSLG